MGSPAAQEDAKAVVEAISSSTCTPATTATLQRLLQPSSAPAPKSRSDAKENNAVAQGRNTGRGGQGARAAQKPVRAAPKEQTKDALSAGERLALATDAFNAALKALSDANKAPRPAADPPSPVRQALRNASTNSPVRKVAHRRASPTVPDVDAATSSGAAAIADCAHLALTYLRSEGKQMPASQLDSGSSALIGKLLGLNLVKEATRELRLYKSRFETPSAGPEKSGRRGTQNVKGGSKTEDTSVASLLDISVAHPGDDALVPIVTYQLHVLRLLSVVRKPILTEAALSYVDPARATSPTALALRVARAKGTNAKIAQQLDQLSRILLSLCPSVASANDELALDASKHMSPGAAFKTQAVAFDARVKWWLIAGHVPDIGKELWEPLAKCAAAYTRRAGADVTGVYATVLRTIEDLQRQLQCEQRNGESLSVDVIRVLGTAAESANKLDEAIRWTRRLRLRLLGSSASDVEKTAVDVKLASLSLENDASGSRQAIDQAVEALRGSLAGRATDQDALLANVMTLRKSAARYILQRAEHCEAESADDEGIARSFHACYAVIVSSARFLLRYIGPSPEENENEAVHTRYLSRAKLSSRALKSVLDSLSLCVKSNTTQPLPWQMLGEAIGDCRSAINQLAGAVDGQDISSHQARIAQIYWAFYVQLRSSGDVQRPEILQSLQRCVGMLRVSSRSVQENGQFVLRLERLATDLATMKRYSDAFEILREAAQWMIADGTLDNVVDAMRSMPLAGAWTIDTNCEKLSSLLRLSEKVRVKIGAPAIEPLCLDIIEGRSDQETAVLLEWQLGNGKIQHAGLLDLLAERLLALYGQATPLRRLRIASFILRTAFTANLDVKEDVLQTAKACITRCKSLQQDAGLARYAKHYDASHMAASAFSTPVPSMDRIRAALQIWSSIAAADVDDIEAWSAQLRLTANYLSVSGPRTLCIDANETLVKALALSPSESKQALEGVQALCNLARQRLQETCAGDALRELAKASQLAEQLSGGPYGRDARIIYLTASAYIDIAAGSHLSALQRLKESRTIASEQSVMASSRSQSFDRMLLSQRLLADASLVASKYSLSAGHRQDAILYAKQALKVDQRIWASIEHGRASRTRSPERHSEPDAPKEKAAKPSAPESSATSLTYDTLSGPLFWPHVPCLFESQLHCAEVLAHVGLWQEAVYYAEQAEKVAQAVKSAPMLAQSTSLLLRYYVQSGRVDQTQDRIESIAGVELDAADTDLRALVRLEQGRALYMEDELELAEEHWDDAMKVCDTTGPKGTMEELEAKIESLSLSTTRKPAQVKKGRGVKSGNAQASRRPARAEEIKSSGQDALDGPKQTLRIAICSAKVQMFLSIGDLQNAEKTLQTFMREGRNVHDKALLLNTFHSVEWVSIMQSLEADLDYSTLCESTLSLPMTLDTPDIVQGSSANNATPFRPPRQRAKESSKSPVKGGKRPAKALSPALARLREEHEGIASTLDAASWDMPDILARRLCRAFLATGLLLASADPRGSAQCAARLCSGLTLPRCDGSRSELDLIRAEAALTKPRALASWPMPAERSASENWTLGAPDSEIQDLLPEVWSVVCLDLNDTQDELLVSRYSAGRAPLLLRLPMRRQRSHDEPEEDAFTFTDGKAELKDIIQLSDMSTHNGRNMAVKGAKRQWWAEREALDARLKDLLVNIENIWFGGFKGVFAPNANSTELVRELQDSLQAILDKHLPSRQGRKKASRVYFDNQVIEVLVGLGDPAERGDDGLFELGNDVLDLLHFLVDILQLNGEQNAYDEIDFDSMVVATLEALKVHHQALKDLSPSADTTHVILVLDKMLHGFPWECMPCLEGRSLSRLPSMHALRERLVLLQTQRTHGREKQPSHAWRASRNSGTSVLNPSGDLTGTQTTLAPHVKQLPSSWTQYIGPKDGAMLSEPTVSHSLGTSAVFCYFGHGSTAQYIRARDVRRLCPTAIPTAAPQAGEEPAAPARCATSLLMGCSSAAVTENGEFHPHGMVLAYLAAGAPAVVGCLWDVTDRDCDRFSVECGRRWGLWAAAIGDDCDDTAASRQPGAKKSRKGKSKLDDRVELPRDAALLRADNSRTCHERQPGRWTGPAEREDIAQAVAASRQACYLKYLNGAAMVVYGIPVVLVD